jgi:acetate kinase
MVIPWCTEHESENNMDILVLNSGSSSLKYILYRWEERLALARGIVERVGQEQSSITHEVTGRDSIKIDHACPTHREAVNLIMEILTSSDNGVVESVETIKAVGHRVVHGGESFKKSVIIDDEALSTFRKLTELAPLHNPSNITGIEAAQRVLPHIPHVAVMDTAWHQTIPDYAYTYALPYEWYTENHIRRYGFHGTSLLYCAKRAAVLLGKHPFETNLIIAHIGNGVSFNAVKKGVSVDTSMGFTPLEGAVMGTRAGDHDPAIGLYMMEQQGLTAREMNNLLNKKSGLLGITGQYIDRRDILHAAERGDSRARLALDIEAYRGRKYIGAYAAALGRVDALIFTAGAGELSPHIRWSMTEGLSELGICIDRDKNEASVTRNAETEITGRESRCRIFIIPTDEEFVMVEDTVALLEGRYDIHTNFIYSFESPDYKNRLREQAFEQEAEQNTSLRQVRIEPRL